MNVRMDPMIITMTQPTQNQKNENVWPPFSINQFYAQPNVVELCFYYQTQTRTKGELAHD
jgi:hypothetical protein